MKIELILIILTNLNPFLLKGEVHPIKNLNKPKFSKPAPPSRGARRITKAPPS